MGEHHNRTTLLAMFRLHIDSSFSDEYLFKGWHTNTSPTQINCVGHRIVEAITEARQ